MSDRIADLSLFLRVADLGSISAAARYLNISVAAASQGLQRLERSLGVRLMHRTTRNLQLTSEGQAFVARVRPLIEDLEAATQTLREGAQQTAGTLRLAIPASFGRRHISPLLPAFLERHPNVKLHVHLADEMLDLVSEGFDLAIRIGALSDSSLVARRLAADRRVLCASPKYLDRRGIPQRPDDLQNHDCLLLTTARAAERRWQFRREGKIASVAVNGPLESNYGELIRDAAVAGLGIAMHSTWMVCEDLRAGRLKIVLPQYSLPEAAVYAVTPERRLVLPRVSAFIEFLVKQFGPTPPWDEHFAHSKRKATKTRRR